MILLFSDFFHTQFHPSYLVGKLLFDIQNCRTLFTKNLMGKFSGVKTLAEKISDNYFQFRRKKFGLEKNSAD